MCYRTGEGPPDVAFLAGRRVGGAVKRNRARRVLREAFRTSEPDLAGIETLVFIATDKAATAPRDLLMEAMTAALRRASDCAD
jgi:ribonuclease P protein component